MSFSSQQTLYYLGNQFQYYLLIGYTKTAALKHQQFGDGESDTKKIRASKYSRVDEYNNEEWHGIDNY